MASLVSNNKLSEAHQREIIERCNTAYDQGGANTLKILVDTLNNIVKDHPELVHHCGFALYVVEAVRADLADTVREQVHDEFPENKIEVELY